MKRRLFRVAIRPNACAVVTVVMGLCSCTITGPTDDASPGNHSATAPFAYGYAVGDHGMLELFAGSGTVEIAGVGDSDVVTIWGEKNVRSLNVDDAQAHLDDIEIQIDSRRDLVRVETTQPDGDNDRLYEVDYRIRVPRNWNVAIYSSNGAVDASMINGSLVVEAANGEVRFDRLLSDVQATVTNGDVLGSLMVAPQSRCEIQVVDGKIDLAIPRTTSAFFSAHVVNGIIDVAELPLVETSSSPSEIHGYLGDAEGSISLKTTNGSIRVCCSR